MHYISIYFDQETNRLLQNYINKVAQKSGNTFMTAQNIPPHITVSAFKTQNENEIISSLEERLKGWKSGTLQWVSVGIFLPYVIYLAPVLNEYLQELSISVYESIQQTKKAVISPFYRPMQWMPHTTIGKTLSKEQMQTAFQVLQENFGIFTGNAVQIGLARTNPYRNLAVINLRNCK